MIEKNHLQKMLKDVLRRSRGAEDHRLMHPEREWYTSVTLAIIAVICGGYLCFHIYWRYDEEKPSASSSEAAVDAMYREQEIAKALQEFSDRKNKQAAFQETLKKSASLNTLPMTEIFIPTEPATATTSAETLLNTPSALEATGTDASTLQPF